MTYTYPHLDWPSLLLYRDLSAWNRSAETQEFGSCSRYPPSAMNEEPEIEVSPLSQKVLSGGRTVRVEIYRLEGEKSWALEVVDEFNNSTVWDDTFDSDSAALTEAKKTILADGVNSLVGPVDGKGEWK